MNETQQNINWLKEEAEKIKQPTQYEELPALKLTPNVVTEIEVDISKEWDKWTGEDIKKQTAITKKIIPVVVSGTRMHWWLNVKNPVYSEIVKSCALGKTKFKVLQTGTREQTKYVLVQ